MKPPTSPALPLVPLLRAYRERMPGLGELGKLPQLGMRFAAILGASARFLYPEFIDNASESDFGEALLRFYEACVSVPLHSERLRRRSGIVRHGLSYLLRGRDPLPQKAANCIDGRGAYHVAGLGPSFWSALLQGLYPTKHPGYTPATLSGLVRLGLARWPAGTGTAVVYAAVQDAYAAIRKAAPDLTALHVDHFLSLVGALRGRNLWQEAMPDADTLVQQATRQERIRLPLRERLKVRGQAFADAQDLLQEGLRSENGKRIGDALAVADPEGAGRSPLDWGQHAEALTLWVGRLWESAVPYETLASLTESDDLAGAGLFLPAAVLHLRDAQAFAPWNDEVRQGYAQLDDSTAHAETLAGQYQLFNEGVAWLRTKYHLHPLEVGDVLAALGTTNRPEAAVTDAFGGFCSDSFQFFRELADNNRRDWMDDQRERYRFAVREPLLELCRALAARYVEPVLKGVHGWELDSVARSGRAVTSICKNAYGRGNPYNSALWIAFCRHKEDGPRDGVQFFVRLDAAGLSYGLRIGRKAALARLREQVRRHGDLLLRTLRDGGALESCRFSSDAVIDLTAWAAQSAPEVSRTLSPDDPLLTGDELVGDILLTFDRLAPLYACCAEEEPLPFLLRRGGESADRFTEADFHDVTHLDADWLRRARALLGLKRQLILQGVPGTGKTHVARCLARLLTGGRDDALRLVQFHPAYSYEEFVEGIRVRSVAVDGRHDVTYPVEDGLLCAFAAEATRRPSEPHVLIVDEINRGNLPRIFGELLYLLEYREQEVRLPYSQRGFRLPANLYVIGTMNAADRSVALVDQALRRRFSFLEMMPDAEVLASWLHRHVPAAGPAFADRVVQLFERVNVRLRADLGPQAQVGHSYFMVDDLDETRLQVVWQHHVRPLLEEHFHGQSARLSGYNLESLLDGETPRSGTRHRQTSVPN